jgi:hypothetical protein
LTGNPKFCTFEYAISSPDRRLYRDALLRQINGPALYSSTDRWSDWRPDSSQERTQHPFLVPGLFYFSAPHNRHFSHAVSEDPAHSGKMPEVLSPHESGRNRLQTLHPAGDY